VGVSWYITIRGTADYTQFAATAPLVEFLAAMPELRQTGPLSFQAVEGQPWVAVSFAVCGPEGNYSSGGLFLPQINIVELVCSYSSVDMSWYDALAVRIARFLGWSAYDEHNVRRVWP
jgi:hypothetical protein